MKIVLILLCCIVGIMAQAQSDRQQLDNARKNCITGLKGFNLKTVALCLTQKAGLLTANGDLDLQAIKQKLAVLVQDAKKEAALVKTCAVKKSSPIETAAAFYLCMGKAGVTYFLIP